jgi:hypothetical protein
MNSKISAELNMQKSKDIAEVHTEIFKEEGLIAKKEFRNSINAPDLEESLLS